MREYSEYPCRYIPKDNRLYLIDKEHSIVSFQVRIYCADSVRGMEIRVRIMEIRAWMMEVRARIMRNAARPPRAYQRKTLSEYVRVL